MAVQLLLGLVLMLMVNECLTSSSSSVVFTNGVYNGLVVAISPTTPRTDRDQLIDSIKKSFMEANERLYTATNRMATFGHITILLPTNWSTQGLQVEAASHQTWSQADVRVGEANPQYGDQPYTLQPGLCGQPASYIHLTPNFFLDTNETQRKYGPIGKVLLHEWTHYRYGVFEEYGYVGDAKYPPVYSDGQQLHPTACSNAYLEGQISEGCSVYGPSDPKCTFQPRWDQPGVNSSIMSMHFLPEVTQFCDSSTHNQFAPTKQNALCGRRSVWQVLKSHSDFNTKWVHTVPYRHPSFSLAQASASRYVLLLDCSSDMNNFVNKNSSAMQRINFVRSAAIRFMEDSLTNGTWLSLIWFGPQAQVLKPLTELNSETRKGFVNAIPLVTCGGPERNVVNALQEAIKQLNTPNSNRTDGTIIIVTNGVTTEDVSRYEDVKRELTSRKIRAINIIYPPMPEVTALPSLAEVTAGRNYMIAEIGAGRKGNSSTLSQLLNALDDAVVSQSGNPVEDRITMYEKVHSVNEGDIRGRFIVDTSVGRNMRVVISYFNRENVFNVQLKNSRRSFDFNNYDDEQKKRTIVFAIKEEDVVTGVWDYEIQVNRHDDQPITVIASAQPRKKHPLTLKAWTNIGNKALNVSNGPLVIHAELFKGSRPVINARVRAFIERPKINNTFTFTEIELFDNGNGAPDATKNDGVYSRYFTEFVEPFGFYSITVMADDNQGQSRVVGDDQRYLWSSAVRSKDPSTTYCCGSEGPPILTESTGPFQRSSTAPAFLVTTPPPTNVDLFPPSPIQDLTVASVDLVSGYISLTWTAPGKDFDKGVVTSYELHYYNDYYGLITNFDSSGQVQEPIYPLAAGSQQTVTFLPPGERNRFYFFALVSFDGNQRSDVSNVVTCFVPPEPTTTTPPTFPTDSTGSVIAPTQPSVARPLLTAELIGIIVGCTLAFLLAVAIIVALICANRRRRKLQEKKMTHHTVSQVHGPDVVRPPSVALLPSNGKESLSNHMNGNGLPPPSLNTSHSDEMGSKNGGVDGIYYTQSSSLINPRQYVPASEFLQHHDKQKHNNYYPTANNQINNSGFYYEDENNKSYNGHYAPMDVILDRTSISSKPSSYGSQQTAEVTSNSGAGYGQMLNPHRGDVVGYVNSSYEDGSENSGETARLRPDNYAPIVTAAPRRVLSESQV